MATIVNVAASAVAARTACSTGRRVAARPIHAPRPFAAGLVAPRRTSHSLMVRSIPVSGPGSASPAPAGGQITSAVITTMKFKIGEALETDTVEIVDVYGDGRHVSIDVVSKLFADKSLMQRQRMVYKAIWLELQEAVHAVDAMTTKTPEEVAGP